MLERLSYEAFYYKSNPNLYIRPISGDAIHLMLSSEDAERLGADGADILWLQLDQRYIDVYFGEYQPLIFRRVDNEEPYEVISLQSFKEEYPLELSVDTITFHLKKSSNFGKAKATFNAIWCTMI